MFRGAYDESLRREHWTPDHEDREAGQEGGRRGRLPKARAVSFKPSAFSHFAWEAQEAAASPRSTAQRIRDKRVRSGGSGQRKRCGAPWRLLVPGAMRASWRPCAPWPLPAWGDGQQQQTRPRSWGGSARPPQRARDPGTPHGQPGTVRGRERNEGWRAGNKQTGGEKGRGSIWKITAVSWLWLLQSRDESSAGCLGNGYFPPAADQFHLHKCPLKL